MGWFSLLNLRLLYWNQSLGIIVSTLQFFECLFRREPSPSYLHFSEGVILPVPSTFNTLEFVPLSLNIRPKICKVEIIAGWKTEMMHATVDCLRQFIHPLIRQLVAGIWDRIFWRLKTKKSYHLPMIDAALQTSPKTQLLTEYLLHQGQFPDCARVLQIGCGDGSLLLRLLEARPDLHCSGLEVSEECVAAARLRVPSGQFAVAQLDQQLPLQGPFDRIFSYGLAQQFTPLEFVAFNERLWRFLWPKGLIHHFAIPNAKQSFQYAMHKWQNKHGNALGSLIGSVDGVLAKWTHKYDPHGYWHDPDIMQASLRHLGTVQLRVPANAWYQFDIKITP